MPSRRLNNEFRHSINVFKLNCTYKMHINLHTHTAPPRPVHASGMNTNLARHFCIVINCREVNRRSASRYTNQMLCVLRRQSSRAVAFDICIARRQAENHIVTVTSSISIVHFPAGSKRRQRHEIMRNNNNNMIYNRARAMRSICCHLLCHLIQNALWISSDIFAFERLSRDWPGTMKI